MPHYTMPYYGIGCYYAKTPFLYTGESPADAGSLSADDMSTAVRPDLLKAKLLAVLAEQNLRDSFEVAHLETQRGRNQNFQPDAAFQHMRPSVSQIVAAFPHRHQPVFHPDNALQHEEAPVEGIPAPVFYSSSRLNQNFAPTVSNRGRNRKNFGLPARQQEKDA